MGNEVGTEYMRLSPINLILMLAESGVLCFFLHQGLIGKGTILPEIAIAWIIFRAVVLTLILYNTLQHTMTKTLFSRYYFVAETLVYAPLAAICFAMGNGELLWTATGILSTYVMSINMFMFYKFEDSK